MSEGLDRRQFVFGSMLLGGAAVAAVARAPATPVMVSQEALEAAIPRQIGRYRQSPTTDIVLPPRDELSKAIYDRYVARGYVAAGLPPIMLLVAYGGTQDYTLQLHRPESCYPASGWAIGPSQPVTMPLGRQMIHATTLSATRPGRHDQLLYWTRIGGIFPGSNWAGRMELLRGAMMRKIPDGVLVRLSTPSLDTAAAIDAMQQFNMDLLAGLGADGRRLLLGPMA